MKGLMFGLAVVFSIFLFCGNTLADVAVYGDAKDVEEDVLYPNEGQPIILSVTTNKEEYRVGETIRCVISLKNLSKKAVMLQNRKEPIDDPSAVIIKDQISPLLPDEANYIVQYELSRFKNDEAEVVRKGQIPIITPVVGSYSNLVIGVGYIGIGGMWDKMNPPIDPGDYILKVRLSHYRLAYTSFYEASAYLKIIGRKFIPL